jgi:phage shock protein PspC (stress-responsive transcriptional regulator)
MPPIPPPPPAAGPAGPYGSPEPPPRPPLRRSNTNRVLAGVSGGLGEYFGVDPVLFRVLFATSAFFGGVGIIAYLVAWAVIPERGAPSAPLDGAARWLRQRRVPFGVAVAVAAIVAWVTLFSWWRPWPFFPLLIVAILLVVVLERNRNQRLAAHGAGTVPPVAPPNVAPMSTSVTDYPFASSAAGVEQTAPTLPYPQAPATGAQTELHAWMSESRDARVRRRTANRPMRLAVWSALTLALLGLGIADAIAGIAIPTYLWVVVGIVIAGLIVGAAIRRPVWGFSAILVPAFVLMFVLGGTSASLHDGSGDRTYTPTSGTELKPTYHQAFGRVTLDLTRVGQLDSTRTVHVRQAAGQVRIIVPQNMDVTMRNHIWLGQVEVDGIEVQSGFNFDREVVFGPGNVDRLTVDVDLSDGQVSIARVG